MSVCKSPPVSGTDARAVSRDLLLKTYMKSTDLRISNSKMWDSISKMVPETTPQQVSEPMFTLTYSAHSFTCSFINAVLQLLLLELELRKYLKQLKLECVM